MKDMTRQPTVRSWWPALLAASCIMLLAAPALSHGQESSGERDVDARLLGELKALDAKLEKIEDLKATITQKKFVALLKEPLTSTGTMLVKGEQMRWDVIKPSPSTTLTSATEIRIHYPQQKIVEVYRIDQRMASVIASPLPRLSVMLKHFRMERLPLPKDADEAKLLGVRLLPRGEELKKHIARVDVRIDRETAVTQRMELVDVDGDRTVIDFDKIEMNVGLKAKDFELVLPAGTRIVHPLESEEKDSR